MYSALTRFVPTFLVLAMCFAVNMHNGILSLLGFDQYMALAVIGSSFLLSLLIFDFDRRFIAVIAGLLVYSNAIMLQGGSHHLTYELFITMAFTLALTPKLLAYNI